MAGNPDNTPITDAAMAELDRMHAAATPGEWQDLEDPGNPELRLMVRNERRHQYMHAPDATWCATIHNAYPALRQRLTDAEFQLSIQAVSSSMRGRSLLEAYKQIEDLQTRLADAERERDGLRASSDAETNHWVTVIRSLDKENLCDFFDGIGAEEGLRDWLAARDARMKREGAAEWLEKNNIELCHVENDDCCDCGAVRDVVAVVERNVKQAAKRLREEK